MVDSCVYILPHDFRPSLTAEPVSNKNDAGAGESIALVEDLFRGYPRRHELARSFVLCGSSRHWITSTIAGFTQPMMDVRAMGVIGDDRVDQDKEGVGFVGRRS